MIMIRTLSVALLVMTSGIALGQNQGGNSQGQNGQGSSSPVAAPEIDPAGAISALMLLAGTVTIIRGYRRRKP